MTTTEQDKRTIPTGGTDTNALYVDVKVFLEGVQIPHAACAISYGVTAPPTCSITLPAASFLRSLPETTKILVIFKDLLPDPITNEYEWRVLFDGEASGVAYSIDPAGANITLSGIHTTAYLTLMQFYTQSSAEYIVNRRHEMVGDYVMCAPSGLNKAHITFINKLFDTNLKHYSSMADITYSILRNMIEGFKDKGGPVAAWYWNKLGPVPGGYKIVDRITGVSEPVLRQEVISCDYTPGDVYTDIVTPKQATSTTTESTNESTTTTDNKAASAGTVSVKDVKVDGMDSKTSVMADRIVECWIQSKVEGGFGSVNYFDRNGYASVGICGWNADKIKTLMNMIYNLGNKDAEAYLTNCTTREEIYRVNPDTSKFHAILNSKEGRQAQIKFAKEITQSYIAEAHAAGIKNDDCVVYFAMWAPTVTIETNGQANRDIGLFVKNRNKDLYPSGIGPEGHTCVDVNNINELASLFKTEYARVMAPDFNYGDRWKTTMEYVNLTKPENTTPSDATAETVKVNTSSLDTGYTVNPEESQRVR